MCGTMTFGTKPHTCKDNLKNVSINTIIPRLIYADLKCLNLNKIFKLTHKQSCTDTTLSQNSDNQYKLLLPN